MQVIPRGTEVSVSIQGRGKRNVGKRKKIKIKKAVLINKIIIKKLNL